ncbi:phosphotransacetylase [symbiont of Argiope bruennichi]|uniref:phosphotransacetylase n=1 Tax=symbiont of Argiope bruennichi TaxID=2810479 RepID=UPI003DA39945
MINYNILIKALKKEPLKKIVFSEGSEIRVIKAAINLAKKNIIIPILLSDEKTVKKVCKEHFLELHQGIQFLNPNSFSEKKRKKFIDETLKLRQNKNSKEEIEKWFYEPNYFSVMLVQFGYADGVIGGANFSTADTIRPAFQIFKADRFASSSMILSTNEKAVIFTDCAIMLDPNGQELAEIAKRGANLYQKIFYKKPVVGFLSYSTKGSGNDTNVPKIKEAINILKNDQVDFIFSGEFQFDAAFSSRVAKKKCNDDKAAGHVNVFVFPNLVSANIGYKIAQLMGNWNVVGPIISGIKKPIFDLSRGCTAEEVFNLSIILAYLI